MGFPDGTSGKEYTSQCRRHNRQGFNPWSGRSPGEGHGNPLHYSCLENAHAQRNLVGYTVWSHEELAITQVT